MVCLSSADMNKKEKERGGHQGSKYTNKEKCKGQSRSGE